MAPRYSLIRSPYFLLLYFILLCFLLPSICLLAPLDRRAEKPKASAPAQPVLPAAANQPELPETASQPVLAEAAKRNTREGFEAFIRYWYETLRRSFETASTDELRVISAASCRTCSAYIEEINALKRSGGSGIATAWVLSAFESDMAPDPLGQVVGRFILEDVDTRGGNADPATYAHGKARGAAMSGASSPENGDSLHGNSLHGDSLHGNSLDGRPKAALAIFQDGRWLMRQIG